MEWGRTALRLFELFWRRMAVCERRTCLRRSLGEEEERDRTGTGDESGVPTKTAEESATRAVSTSSIMMEGGGGEEGADLC